MANPKKTELMLSLLHLIIDTDRLWAPMCGVGVIVSCLCNTPHPVSDDTFLLLEEVESGLGSADQKTEKIVGSISPGTPIFLALSTRVLRQKDPIKAGDVISLRCRSLADAKLAHTLLSNIERINWRGSIASFDVNIGGEDIGEEGWAALATGLQRRPGFTRVFVSRHLMKQASRASLRTTWDALGALGSPSTWSVAGLAGFRKDGLTEEGSEEKWAKLLKILE